MGFIMCQGVRRGLVARRGVAAWGGVPGAGRAHESHDAASRRAKTAAEASKAVRAAMGGPGEQQNSASRGSGGDHPASQLAW